MLTAVDINCIILLFQGIVVDIDSGSVLVEEGDENKILSSSMQKVWRRSIALANKAAASVDYVRSVYLSDAYLQVFILCFKDYKKYIVNGNFQVWTTIIQSVPYKKRHVNTIIMMVSLASCPLLFWTWTNVFWYIAVFHNIVSTYKIEKK